MQYTFEWIMKYLFLTAIFYLSALPLLAQESVAQHGLKVIGGLNLDGLTEKQLQRFFSLRQRLSPQNRPISLVRLPLTSSATQQFSKSLFQLYPYQLQRIWDRQIYSGKAKAPVTVKSEQDMLALIASEPDALGYISHSTSIPEELKGKIHVLAIY